MELEELAQLKESDPWRPTNYLYFEPYPIAGGEGTGTPMQELEADVQYLEDRPVPSEWLRPAPIAHPIAGGDGTGTPMLELSVDLDELAQVVADIKQRQPRMLTQTGVNAAGRIWC